MTKQNKVLSSKTENQHRIQPLTAGFLLVGILLCNACSNISIDNLQCEYLTCPTGIDNPRPRLSWTIAANEREVYQTACCITLSEENSDEPLWNTGWVESDKTAVIYNGRELKTDRSYIWQVSTRINGKEIKSKPTEFHTGLLNGGEWKAAWITAKKDFVHESPLLRSEFAVKKEVKSAWIFASAAGFYELYLNGNAVGSDKMNPTITDYRKTLLYSVYDVGALLNKGINTIGAMLGNSAFNKQKVRGRFDWFESSNSGPPRFSMQMRIVYRDGSDTLITTDSHWKYAFGPITYNNAYNGETYDARLEQEGWSKNNFDDIDWHPVATVNAPGGVLRWQPVPVKVMETLVPVAATHPAKGKYLFDLGQNIAGWWRVQIKGKPGQTIRIRGAETLNNDRFAKNLEEGDSLNFKEFYHSSVWTDYTMKSHETETYEPRFFYTGFRYVEVLAGDDLDALEVEGRATYSALEQNGEWTSSNEILNQTHKIGLWSMKGNLIGYPTDCPHREKGAYNGDGQVAAEASMHDFHIIPFYRKWLNDMRDAQEPNGRIPNTSPTLMGGTGGGVGWGSAYVLLSWWIYKYHDDKEIMREHYPSMKRYIDYLRQLARNDEHPEEPYIINFFDQYWFSLGEWMAPGQSDCPNHAVVNTFYYAYDVKLMSQIATLLGNDDDSQYYRALHDTIRQAFNEKFLSPQTQIYGVDSTYQTYQLLALAGDLVPKEYRAGVLQTIADDIKTRNNHLNTGMIGTKYLWTILSDAGFHNLIYQVATQETYPSYGYWLNNNFTTMPEDWQGVLSHNHQLFVSVIEYFYCCLAGIRTPEQGGTANAYKHIVIQPCMPDSLNRVKASLQTSAGKIVSGWERRNKGEYTCEVSIPANTTASLLLPATEHTRLTESGKTIWENGSATSKITGIRSVRAANNRIEIELGSGNYFFNCKL
ncbi:MAG: glycoside hydrolase family 78 protein [Prevotellaceae bacterium]|jgi:alpha-L-rhamnosidase|nr:glycoside hydrolase family 78 protein [Prevotellaceae bacterium]